MICKNKECKKEFKESEIDELEFFHCCDCDNIEYIMRVCPHCGCDVDEEPDDSADDDRKAYLAPAVPPEKMKF